MNHTEQDFHRKLLFQLNEATNLLIKIQIQIENETTSSSVKQKNTFKIIFFKDLKTD